MALVDSQRVAAIIREVAIEAVLPRFRNLKDGDIKTKSGPTDLVTIADIESEHLLTAALTKLLPGSVVVGEEAAAADASVLDRLDGDAPVWILDPVDGTAMFAKGDPGFAMIVALVHKGKTIAGWIHDPVPNRTAYTELGQGAWLDGQPMKVAADRPISDMVGGVWWSPAVKAIEPKVRGTRNPYSAGLGYLALASGELDFAVFRRLNPWDHAAGVLMHLEAGGTAKLVDGEPYRPVMITKPLVVAPGPDSWKALAALVPTA
ncbi:MAG TPA: inositol monophosphatase family protein [Magnetospirillaceae bacterium]|jgi:fructose-1,6-bisphosphatase/inositol monophosphatase family enzyme